MNKLLISKLVGLVRAIDGNEFLVTKETNQLILKSLSYIYDNNTSTIEEEILDEKKRIIPSCFVCDNACGKTLDYDFNLFDNDPKMIKEYKIEIISLLSNINTLNNIELIYKAIYSIGVDDWEENIYIDIIKNLKSII